MSWSAAFSLSLGALLFGLVTRTATPPLAWAAVVLVLHGTRTLPVAGGAALTWTAFYVAFAVTKRGVVPLPEPVYWFIILGEATLVTLPFVIDRLAAARLPVVAGTLLFALAMTAIEFLRSRVTIGASWGSLGYTQFGFRPMMQLASVTGVWGITFLICWTASTAERAWRGGLAAVDMQAAVVLCGTSLVAVIVGGWLRTTFAAPADRIVRVATLNRPRDLFAPGEMTRITEGRVASTERARVDAQLARLQDWFLDGSRREARAGAELIAWPEQSLLVFAAGETAFLDRARRLAAAERVYLAMGLGTIHPGDRFPFENKLVIVDPSGAIVMTHLKTRPVAGWEASIMKRGSGPLPVIGSKFGRVGGLICFEGDFPELVTDVGRQRAVLAIIPVNDWKIIAQAHMQLHAFRAIENGVTLLRPAASGISAAVDPYGRVLATADFFASGGGTMRAQLPIRGVATMYARWGDWFAWSCAAALAVLLSAAVAVLTLR